MNNNIRNQETVCAVVVTYNRKNLLLECLEAIKKQTKPVDAIYLIDNASTDGTPELLMEKGYISELPPQELKELWEKEFEINNLVDGRPIKLYYVRMHENTGGAGGFHEGVKRAYEKGYDWFWLMDDDVSPTNNCLYEMLKESISEINLCFLPSRKTMNGEDIIWYPFFSRFFLRSWNSDCIKSNTIYFEGLLINRQVVSKIGFPEPKFFTVLDDAEYGLRISKVTKIKYVQSAILIRLLSSSKKINVLDKRYYFFRNLFLLAKLQKIPIFWTAIIVFIQVLGSIVKSLLFERNKFQTAIVLLKAYKDGFGNKYGKMNLQLLK